MEVSGLQRTAGTFTRGLTPWVSCAFKPNRRAVTEHSSLPAEQLGCRPQPSPCMGQLSLLHTGRTRRKGITMGFP